MTEAEPDTDCILVCAWDTYHQGTENQHGVIVCQQCERLVRCVAHMSHGAMLVDGTVVVTGTIEEEEA